MSKCKAKEDKRQCLVCGGSLAGKQKTAKFCSDEHRSEWHKSKRNKNKEEVVKNKACKICSGKFVVKGNSRRVYCSDKCSKVAHGLKSKEWRERKKNNPKKECLYCSKDITGKIGMYCSKGCSDEARKKQRREKYRKDNGLYDKYNKERKCKYCSKDISDRELHAVYCDDRCGDMFRYFETTTSMPIDEYRKMIAEQAKETKRKRLANKTITMYRPECLECGERFKTLTKSQRICSDKCRRSRNNRRKDTRIPEAQIVDRDIALPKLYIRDKGICYLCNEKCDYSDIKTTKDGYKYAGDTYPSIDHVMPVVHGGLHAWDNIRLAHRHCNSIKSDTIPDDLKELLPDDAYAMASTISPRMKTTLQFNTKGKLVGTYESTAQAERETGVKRKGIQNCARGECKTYGGYVWEYA